MKRMYRSPGLVEFGPIGRLTLGTGGNLPDYGPTGLINNNCITETFVDNGVTFTRVVCGNAPVQT
jgi:hypothetical protein